MTRARRKWPITKEIRTKTIKYEKFHTYSRRPILRKPKFDTQLQTLRQVGNVSYFNSLTDHFIIVSQENAFIHVGATYLGCHLSTLFLFCKNLIRLHDTDVHPVMCIVSEKNWTMPQTSATSVDLRRSRTKFLGNLITRGNKETIMRAYGNSMMNVWSFLQKQHAVSHVSNSMLTLLFRAKNAWTFKTTAVDYLNTVLIDAYYKFSHAINSPNMLEEFIKVTGGTQNPALLQIFFYLFFKAYNILAKRTHGLHNITREGYAQHINKFFKLRLLKKQYVAATNNILAGHSGLPLVSTTTDKRVHNYAIHNNIRLFDPETMVATYKYNNLCYTNCDFFYKLVYNSCPIMLYTVQRKDKWRYKHGRKGESKYAFNLRNLNPDERLYFAFRYARYSYLFSQQRTVGLRMFTYLFGMFRWPSRMLIHYMGLRATTKVCMSSGNKLVTK